MNWKLEVEKYIELENVIILLVLFLLSFLFITRTSPSKSREDISVGLKREGYEECSPKEIANNKVLNPAAFKEFSVLEIINISPNTKLLRVAIPDEKSLDIPVGRHISLRADIDGVKVVRPYTPTSRPDQKGFFDIVAKRYENGKLSSYLHNLRVGSKIEVRGPVGRFSYQKNSFKKVALVAGGTGLTPCLQLMRCILEGKEREGDNTSFIFLFQNRCESDVLLREELDVLANKFPDRVEIKYYLSNPSEQSWGSAAREVRGYINADAIRQHVAVDECGLICVCGPSGFNESMKALLVAHGHPQSSIYIW